MLPGLSVYVCERDRKSECVCVCACICVCVHMCVYVCVSECAHVCARVILFNATLQLPNNIGSMVKNTVMKYNSIPQRSSQCKLQHIVQIQPWCNPT